MGWNPELSLIVSQSRTTGAFPMANSSTKTANFRGRGDHDQNGTVGGAARPTGTVNTEDRQPDSRPNVEPSEAQPHTELGDGQDSDKGQVPANVAEDVNRNAAIPENESWGDRQARVARENERKLGQGQKPTTPGETGATSPSDRVEVGDLQQPNPQTVGR